ncbi:MAG TPA: iron-containing alcohol dehydrogenase [Steroidobacteraceae bacterium]|nr:iron-containing alcohol dehydrogenase [Steroidobacteraceae bacterium]
MALINYLTQIHFAHGALSVLPDECARLDIRRPLIVTDPGVRQAGLVDRLLAAMNHPAEPVIFDQTPANPTEQAIRTAANRFTAHKCDGIIALGGGSSIDLGKGVSIAATHSGPLRTFALIEQGMNKINRSVSPLIAIPTTAGTGSEVGRAAVIILEDGRKVGLISPHIIPKAAICDPELTIGLPAGLTAGSGMDAIAHCIETFLSPAFNPPADGIALDGLRRGWAFIERATFSPQDRDARLNMMSASLQGALAFQKGLGCVHSLSHSLGGIDPRLHHGTLNALFLPAVIEFNMAAPSVTRENCLPRLAEAMRIADPAKVPDAIREMNGKIGLPKGLGEVGVTRGSFPQVIDRALLDHCHKTNPRVATSDDYREILEASM